MEDLNKKYNLSEIVKGKSLFCATGITDGDLVEGVKKVDGQYHTETLVAHKNSNINVVKNKVTIA